jgi:murein DD-endopeptidase MepM/ murein hydrolase activator NlpD
MRWLRSGKLVQWTRLVLGLWNREYHDSRIILEQQGDLRYLVISGRLQRNTIRTSMVVLGLLTTMAVSMTLTAGYLQTRKMMLEHSHREIFFALQSAGINPDLQSGEYSQDDMLEMARAIRERDMQIRQYVGDWTDTLAARNNDLRTMISSSGLNGKVISIIQRSQPVGGFSDNFQENTLLGGAFAKETAANRELRSVLEALPDKMPLPDYAITSEFGIRPHPITNKPNLHAGIDIKSQNGDDRVRAVKPGKVLVAGFHGNLGNAILIRHDRGVETLYGHLDKIFVKEGDKIEQDQPIGLVGNTGQSTGKHLHFEVLVGSYQVDPHKVIQTAQYVRQTQK